MKTGAWVLTPYPSEKLDRWPSPPAIYQTQEGLRVHDHALESAVLAEELGFDWISSSEHHYWGVIPNPNPAVTLAALSQVVKRVKLAWLGPLVSMNNPVRIAEEIAALDQISGGRVMVVFLRGTPFEFLAYDTNPDETRALTQEAVELIVTSLREPQPFSWEGRHFRFRTVAVWPRLTQSDPGFFSAGNSSESATFAARNRLGLGVSFYTPEMCGGCADIYRSEAAKGGWMPTAENILYRAFACVGETEQEAARLRANFFGPHGGFFGGLRGRGAATADKFEPGPGGLQAFLDGMVRFCGTPQTVLEQIEYARDIIGMGHLDLGFNGGGLNYEETLRSLRLFGEQVLPALGTLGDPMRSLTQATPS